MYRISVLAENRQNGLIYADRIRRFCMENGIFPEVKVYENQERFFEQIQMLEPTSVLLALHGVNGLNAAEHLRSLYPRCGMIWCSDLDFSLHAFRLRAEYFFMEPVEDEDFRSGWSAEKSPVVSAGVKTADGNSCLNLRKEEKYEEEK